MKNWDTLEADENLLMNTHYTPGRSGRNIDKIVIHHNAGNLSIACCYNLWQTREASAHYQVDANGPHRPARLGCRHRMARRRLGRQHHQHRQSNTPTSTRTRDHQRRHIGQRRSLGGRAVQILRARPTPVVRERVPALPVQRHRMPDQPRRHPERGLHGKSPAVVRQHDRRHPGAHAKPTGHARDKPRSARRRRHPRRLRQRRRTQAAARQPSTTRSWQSSTPATESPPTPLSPPPTQASTSTASHVASSTANSVSATPEKPPSAATTKPCRRASTSYSRRHRHQQHRPERIGGCGHPWRLRQRRSTPSRTRSQLQRRAGARQQELGY